MAYCMKCGNDIGEYNFCRKCGAENVLKENSDETSQQATANSHPNNQYNANPNYQASRNYSSQNDPTQHIHSNNSMFKGLTQNEMFLSTSIVIFIPISIIVVYFWIKPKNSEYAKSLMGVAFSVFVMYLLVILNGVGILAPILAIIMIIGMYLHVYHDVFNVAERHNN